MQTKQEFYTYLDRKYNKKPSTYTADEIYEIGLLHKTLPQTEKSWGDLVEYLGYAGTASGLRSFVNYRAAREKEQTEFIENFSDEISAEEKSFQDIFKDKVKTRDAVNTYKAMLRNEARLEAFKESLIQAIKTIKPIEVKVSKDSKVSKPNKDIEAVALLSDLHIGTNCNNFYNTFNSKVAKTRLDKYAEEIIHYCNLMKVSKLNVLNLGDLISGNIHTNARITAEFDLVDQITKAAELVSAFLIKLTSLGIDVTYRSCTDNHSRATANKDEAIESENFNRLIDWYLEVRLQKYPIKFINDNIDISLGKFDLLNGKKVMFAHGHLENINKCIDSFCGATREFIDYVILSHFHTSKEKSYNGGKVIVNGSIVGTEQYALSKRLFSSAEQKLLIFEKDNLINITINLQ